MISFLGAWGSLWQSTVITEYFSSAKGNIKLEGKSENITLWPQEKVEEPVDLIVKDTFTHLSYNHQYELRNNKSLFINFIYGENSEDNRALADQGFFLPTKQNFSSSAFTISG